MMTPPVLLQLPQDLATAYNFGGVTVHCLFQLLIEHKLSENNWILATVKGCTKVMHTNLHSSKLIIIDEMLFGCGYYPAMFRLMLIHATVRYNLTCTKTGMICVMCY